MIMSATIKCKGCGADLVYKPGTNGLTCNYCSHYTVFDESVPAANESGIELDLDTYLQSDRNEQPQVEKRVLGCSECGAKTELDTKQQSKVCPFCEAPLVVAQAHVEKLIKPKGMLPFKIDKDDASVSIKKWLGSLWFAPKALKQGAQLDKLKGIYLPFWTFDCLTHTTYFGERGVYYNEETTEKNAEGKEITREVRKTRWHPVSGSLEHRFDDVLVPATKTFSESQLDFLAPWDLDNLMDYKDEYLRGFTTEVYQIDVKSGYATAKPCMEEELQKFIKVEIGGDDQRVTSANTRYSKATFKHLLLPVWVSAYHYKDKLYQILVNARTGEVYGERPWNKLAIAALVCAIVGVIAAVVWFWPNSPR